MSATHQIKCDGCEVDLTYRRNSADSRLRLSSEPMDGAVTAMMTWPGSTGDKHFCGLGCLGTWLASEDDAS